MNEEIKPVTPATNPASTQTPKRSGWLPVVILLIVFLVGYVPMWLKSNRLNKELFHAQRQARLERIQMTFANATLDARRGEYEAARQGMATFFSLVTAETDRGIGSVLSASASEALKPLLAQRDDLITLLARGDPAAAERLAAAYAEFRGGIIPSAYSAGKSQP